MSVAIPRFSDARVLVVGDVMLDRYHRGASTRVSPEAPVPIVKVDAVEEHAGGAANVALNLATLGVEVSLTGLIGTGRNGRRLKELLDVAKVKHRLVELEGARTTVKSRIISHHGRQLLRFDAEEGFGDAGRESLRGVFAELLADVDAVIFSDYAKGCLADIEALLADARKSGKATFVDPKGADFGPYRGAGVLTPNYSEFVAVAGEDGNLRENAEALRANLDLDALVVTLSEHGMLLVEKGREPVTFSAEAHEVYDVTGAGDTAVAVMAAAFAGGAPLSLAVRCANCAAGVVVGKLGTATVTPAELAAKLAGGGHVLCADALCDKAGLLKKVGEARRYGARIVMTNGCFDILHAGHVAYLERAATHGDRLVIAVNDDASVARLKGDKRPVNPLEQRMRVLGALRAVDWVVAFSDDTPASLIAEVSPDVLVKGGDYREDEIAGADHVRANGGEVLVLDYVDDCSTSAMLNRIGDA